MKLRVFSYPKINLALDILRKDSSGYHEIQTVFHRLSAPTDEIILEKCEDDIIEVASNNPHLSSDNTNTVLKAAFLLKKHSGIKNGVRIFIKKQIPLMSGLGGGASNAVATLKGLAKLWAVQCCSAMVRPSNHDTNCLLRRIADQIGMDCSFFFDGGTALGEHFGEKITPLPSLSNNINFEIIETGVEISSHWAYQQVNVNHCGKNTEKTKKLIEAIRKHDAKGILENLHNDFGEFIFAKYPQLLKRKHLIEQEKSGRVLVAGSGGCLVRCYS